MDFTRRQFVSFLALSAARAQETPTFSTEVKVVNVLATVTTKRGELVTTLGKDDFVLLENGRPETIRYFSRQTDLPLTIGLMVDTSMSQRRVIDAERGASMSFIDEVLRENQDHVFLMQFDIGILMRQDLTSSARKLDDALAFVDTPTMKELRAQSSGGTLLYDAVVKASDEVMQRQTGRKALILLTDGVDIGSSATLSDAIEAAQRADTLVYSILFSDAGAYGFLGGGDGRGALTRISRETGGGFFEVTKKQGIGQIFDAIQQELRSQYNLGYVSDEPVRVSEFRRIQLTTKEKGFVVQARDRYWARR